MYQIYQTDAFVMDKRSFGEADQLITLYTEKFGKIYAVVQGVRYLKSKLRYSLDLFSFVRVGLVAGRDFWRIVDAEEVKSSTPFLDHQDNYIVFSRAIKLFDKMIQGEEKNEFLWKRLRQFFDDLTNRKRSRTELRELEINFLVDIFDNLGYINRDEIQDQKTAITAINKAIKESML